MNKYQNEIYKIFEGVSDSLGEILEEEKVIIAGGIISRAFSGRNTKDADVDVYFRSKESLARALYAIEGTSNIVVDWTDKSIMIKCDKDGAIVQFVIIDYFENANQIFEKFDFTCVMGAFDFSLGNGGEFVFHEDFMIHNAQRKLVYNPKTDFPIISALRVNKYEREGYGISKNEFVKILLSIMNLKVYSWEDAEKQFGKFYGTSLSGMITEELKEKQFSMDVLLSVVENYSFVQDVTPPQEKRIENWSEFVISITGVKEKAYTFKNNKYFAIKGSNEFVFVGEHNKEHYELIDNHSIFGSNLNKVYKYVVMTEDGRYVSQYNSEFEYKIGVRATDNNRGLWFYYFPGINNAKKMYGNNQNRVLMELDLIEIKSEALTPDSDGQAFELLPVRIVSREEEKVLLEKSSKLSFGFSSYYNNPPF